MWDQTCPPGNRHGTGVVVRTYPQRSQSGYMVQVRSARGEICLDAAWLAPIQHWETTERNRHTI